MHKDRNFLASYGSLEYLHRFLSRNLSDSRFVGNRDMNEEVYFLEFLTTVSEIMKDSIEQIDIHKKAIEDRWKSLEVLSKLGAKECPEM